MFTPRVFTYAELPMIDRELARSWSAGGPLPERALRWSWFREAAPACFQRAALALGLHAQVDAGRLAQAFFEWVGTLEPNSGFDALDPIDHAHYGSGSLLRALLRAAPVSCHSGVAPTSADAVLQHWRAWPEAAIHTRLALTLLDAWRQSLGAPSLELDGAAVTPAHIASYFENVREDATQVIAFLDLFTGLEPVWRFPAQENERPAMRRAQAARRVISS